VATLKIAIQVVWTISVVGAATFSVLLMAGSSTDLLALSP